MVEQSQKKKAKNLKKLKSFRIHIGKQYIDPKKHPSKYEVPKALEGWSEENPPSAEYNELMAKLLSAARYIAMNLNEGPEVGDSWTKRILALKTVMHELVFSTFLNGYGRYGLLLELMNDVYMDISGNIKVLMLMAQLKMRASQQKVTEELKKRSAYTQ